MDSNLLWFGFWLGMAVAALVMIAATTVYLGVEAGINRRWTQIHTDRNLNTETQRKLS